MLNLPGTVFTSDMSPDGQQFVFGGASTTLDVYAVLKEGGAESY